VNEAGEVVLDTLIKIDTSTVKVKPGKKTALLEVSNSRGPSLESVKGKVLSLIAGRTVVGYNPHNSLRDLGVAAPDTRLVNCASMFNSDGKLEPLNRLCQRYLNFREYSRPFPYALTEARVCMALYQAKQSGQELPQESKANDSVKPGKDPVKMVLTDKPCFERFDRLETVPIGSTLQSNNPGKLLLTGSELNSTIEALITDAV